MLKERYADACIATLDRFSPGFSERIGERVLLSDRYFNSAFSAHRGDFAHGTLSPWQLWTKRMIPDEAKDATPIQNLYMCGQGTHPGPGSPASPAGTAERCREHLNARTIPASV